MGICFSLFANACSSGGSPIRNFGSGGPVVLLSLID